MKNQIKIRDFISDDKGRVVTILQGANSFNPETSDLRYLAYGFTKNEYYNSCVAVIDNQTAAFGSIFLFTRIRGGYAAVIEDVAVRDDLRGRGICGLITKKLIDYAKAKNCFKLTLVSSQ